MNQHETDVINLFISHGIVLYKIEEKKNQKTPDFFSTRGGKMSLFELKTREGEEKLSNEKEKILNSGGVYDHADYRNINTGNKKAALESIDLSVEQLKSGRNDFISDYNFIIFDLKDIHKKLTKERLIKTLFGMGDVTYTKEKSTHSKRCLYLHESSFYNHKDILDGVFFYITDQLTLLVNPFSVHYNKLIKGRMFKNISKDNR